MVIAHCLTHEITVIEPEKAVCAKAHHTNPDFLLIPEKPEDLDLVPPTEFTLGEKVYVMGDGTEFWLYEVLSL